jgi:hypothetical protein
MTRGWTCAEDQLLRELVAKHQSQWPIIAGHFRSRKPSEVKSRWNNRIGYSTTKGSFTIEEDNIIRERATAPGGPNWIEIASLLKGRAPKQCRERWHNRLNPDVIHRPWTEEEDLIIFAAVQDSGTKWSLISKSLRGRTDNDVKNRYNSSLLGRTGRDALNQKVLLPSTARKYRQTSTTRKPAAYATSIRSPLLPQPSVSPPPAPKDQSKGRQPPSARTDLGFDELEPWNEGLEVLDMH